MDSIGKKIKFIRKEKGLTQKGFGEEIKVTKQQISNIENELCNPSIEFLSKMILYFNVNSNWLLADIGEPFISKNIDSLEKMHDKILNEVEEMFKKRGL